MKKLICLDLDGTLLKNNGTISKNTIDVINKVQNQGNEVVICTARARNFAINISKKLNASKYVITSNGAEIYDYRNNKVIYSDGIDKSIVGDIWKYCQSMGFKISLAIEDKEYVNVKFRNGQTIIEKYSKLANDYRNIKQCMIVSNDYAKLTEYLKICKKNKNVKLSADKVILEECGYWFSLLSPIANKGNGIYQLSKKLNISKENIISFGNDLNDVTMFENSGCNIAVSNSEVQLLKLADIITLSNEEDGVAHWLNKNILFEKNKS